MCMGQMAALPGNMVGSLWGDKDLGEKTLTGGALRKMDSAVQSTLFPSTGAAPAMRGPQQTETRAARQGSALLS